MSPTDRIVQPENARSRRTRAAVLDAVRALVERAGPGAVTMAAVATEAKVSRRAVYLHFASRAELLLALIGHVEETEGLHASVQHVWDAPDAETALTEWARHLARFLPQVRTLDLAVERARVTDSAADAQWQLIAADQQRACRRLAERLRTEHRLARPWTVDTATDLLWALMSPALLRSLLDDCGWSTAAYTDHMIALLHATFLA